MTPHAMPDPTFEEFADGYDAFGGILSDDLVPKSDDSFQTKILFLAARSGVSMGRRVTVQLYDILKKHEDVLDDADAKTLRLFANTCRIARLQELEGSS